MMKKRWDDLFSRLGAIDSDTLYEELDTLYSEPHRAYHNWKHIADCLTHLDRHLQHHPIPNNNSIALELAIWYHDAIYAPFRNDNEEASGRLATRKLAALCLDTQLINSVESLILITKHNGNPATSTEALMVDIDLATLGSTKKVYAVYEAAIRQEYKRVPMPLYRRKRKAVLHAFLARDRIYTTAPFHEEFEAQARVNLAWAIGEL